MSPAQLQSIRAVLGPMTSEAKCRAVFEAVLLSVREPSEVQYDALCATDLMWREQTSKSVWSTYIDALLAE